MATSRRDEIYEEFEIAMSHSFDGPTKCLYYIAKPGEARDFASSVTPSPDWARSIKDQGYRIFRVTFSLPRGWDSADRSVTVLRTDAVEDVTNDL